MNVHEKARELVRAVKEQDVYKDFVESKQQVFSDSKLKEMLLDLRRAELDLHRRKLAGETVGDKEQEKLQQLYELARVNSVLARYLEVEYRFSMLMMDIQKIINEAVPLKKADMAKKD